MEHQDILLGHEAQRDLRAGGGHGWSRRWGRQLDQAVRRHVLLPSPATPRMTTRHALVTSFVVSRDASHELLRFSFCATRHLDREHGGRFASHNRGSAPVMADLDLAALAYTIGKARGFAFFRSTGDRLWHVCSMEGQAPRLSLRRAKKVQRPPERSMMPKRTRGGRARPMATKATKIAGTAARTKYRSQKERTRLRLGRVPVVHADVEGEQAHNANPYLRRRGHGKETQEQMGISTSATPGKSR